MASVARIVFKGVPTDVVLYEFASQRDEKGKPIAEIYLTTCMSRWGNGISMDASESAL